jgi:hypothetical protein
VVNVVTVKNKEEMMMFIKEGFKPYYHKTVKRWYLRRGQQRHIIARELEADAESIAMELKPKLHRVPNYKVAEAVKMRVGSPTFGKWVGVYLSEENKHMLWIPPGFAHGFLVVSDYAEVIYKVSHSEYSPAHDAGIIWNDPTIGIEWPLHLVDEIILSKKDENLPILKELSEEDLL